MRSLIVLLLVFVSISVSAQDFSFMKTIDGCHIIVEELDEPAKNLGITENGIEAGVTEMFNDVRIRKQTFNSDAPKFYIVLSSIYVTDRKSVLYHISVELYDYITYKGNFTRATIWDRSYTGMIGSNVDKSEILNSLNDLLDLFKADYIAGRN